MHLPCSFRWTASLAATLIIAGAPVACAAATLGTMPHKVLTVALFDFQTNDSALEKPCAAISAFLNVHLSTMPRVMLVERTEVEKVLSEQSFGASGTVTPETAAKLGALLGAKVIVTGRVLTAGSQIAIVAKVIGTDTGRVFATKAWVPAIDGYLDSSSAELAKSIATLIDAESANLLATVETSAQRVDRLHRLIEGKKLPTVAVKITEQHLARPVPDPAAQTELMKLLKELGFDVITPEQAAGRKDVVTISGEAFSELAVRRGSLVSCRGRVEILAKTGNGDLITADREMDIAVDVAEHIAGKQAVENATLKLANRLVPRLATIGER